MGRARIARRRQSVQCLIPQLSRSQSIQASRRAAISTTAGRLASITPSGHSSGAPASLRQAGSDRQALQWAFISQPNSLYIFCLIRNLQLLMPFRCDPCRLVRLCCKRRVHLLATKARRTERLKLLFWQKRMCPVRRKPSARLARGTTIHLYPIGQM